MPRPELIVALDVDGTILHHDEHLDGRVAAAIKALHRLDDVHVVVATGRSVLSLAPVLDSLGLDQGWAVASNGAVTLRLDAEHPLGFEIADLVTFDPGPMLELLRREMPGAIFAVEDAGVGFRLSEKFPEGELTEPFEVVPFDELSSRAVSRVVVRDPGSTPAEFVTLSENLGFHGVSFSVGWTAWLDLAPEGVSKASALEGVRRRLGVDSRHTVAVGDGRNDLEMFAWAARAVAMGQAPQEVRAAADEVCAGVHEGGLADVLEDIIDSRA